MDGADTGLLAQIETLRRRLDELERERSLSTPEEAAPVGRRGPSAESLAEVGRLLAHSLDPREAAQRIADSIRSLLEARASGVFRLDLAGDLRGLAGSGDLTLAWGHGLVVPQGTGLAWVAVRERRPVTTGDLLDDPRVAHTPEGRSRIEASGYRAALAAPLLVSGTVVGALVVRDRSGRVFDAEEMELAQAFADHAALALENARLYEEARRARDFLQSITESSTDAIVTTDIHGRITYFSPGAEELFGHRAREVLGRPVATYYPGGLDEAQAVMRRLLDEGKIPSYESGVLVRDGRRVETTSSLSLLHDANGAVAGTLGVIRDLTERRRAEQALRASEDRFRSAFEHSAFGMALQGLDGRYVRVNRAFCELVGYSEQELLGMTWMALTHAEDVEGDKADALVRGEIRTYQVEKRYVHKQGHAVWALVGVSLVRAADGTPLYQIVQVQDVSERKRAEDARQRLEVELRQAQKMEAIGRLAGGIAHDFNNLLTVIRGRSELLLYRLKDDGPLRRHVELLRQTAERASALTQQLLAFSRKQVLQPRTLNLNSVVAGIQGMLRRLIGEHIELVIRPDPSLGWVRADPGQLEQVVLNLAVNARDAMPDGGRLTIETANVELDEAVVRHHQGPSAGPFVRLSVRDTGIGMDAEVQAHLFEPFFTTKGVGHGTGLGLATVYGVVKQSGGYVEAESAPGKGAVFAIALPRVEAPEAVAEPGTVPEGPARGWETILLVEDEPQVRELGREVLEMHGYTVLEAPDGVRALEVAHQHAGPIHLMVTDVVMPHMSGRDLALRLAPVRPGTKVLYVSGYSDDRIVPEGLLAPGTSYLPKPFTPESLARRVRELLNATPSV